MDGEWGCIGEGELGGDKAGDVRIMAERGMMSGLKYIEGQLIDTSALADIFAGLGELDIENPREVFPFTPQPRQEKMIEAAGLLGWWRGDEGKKEPVTRLVGYGGAAYGGKSYGMLGLAGIWALAYPGSQIAYFRRTYKELEGPGAAMQKAYELFGSIGKARDSGKEWQINNGSRFYFQHCEQEMDVHKYQSKQIDLLLIDEATSFTWFQIDYLLTRNRVSGRNGVLKPMAVLSTNPGNIGHGWFMQTFDLEDLRKWMGESALPRKIRNPNGREAEVYFIPSFIGDNAIGLEQDPEYEQRLRESDPDLAEALIKGDWKVFGGQAFRQFDPAIHVCDPFEIPKNWPKWRAVDWGYDAPFCCLWFTRQPGIGRVYVYREIYQAGMTDAEQADAIALNSPADENVNITFGDPKSFWTAKSRGGVVYNSADEYMDRGVPLWKADNDRLNGKKKIDQGLALLPDGKPGLIFFKNCVNLIRTIPKLARSKVNPEDVDPDQEAHAYDTLRYAHTNLGMFSGARKEQKPQDNPWNAVKGI